MATKRLIGSSNPQLNQPAAFATGDARRQRPMPRQHDAAGAVGMLVHVMVAAVANDPALADQSRRHPGAICFRERY
jgi:hypothetical protein